jgi:hypothetical protein
MDSDAANNALQAWDLLHGNLLLHGWIIGDATYYTFELPLYALVESIFGLHAIVPHIVSSLVYVGVAICAIALARIGCRGRPAWIRTGVVVAILAAPLLTAPGVSIALEKPDHTGTSAITLACFLLIDRASGRRYMPFLLCAILVLGQVSDATVVYVTVPAIALICLYRMIFRRRLGLPGRLRLPDTATLAAAGASVPLANLAQAGLRHAGGFLMVAPQTGVARWAQLPHNLALTGRALRVLFGAVSLTTTPGQNTPPLGNVGAAFGWLCLAAALFGFGKVVWNWPRASRAEQMLCVAIVINIAAYVFSTMPVQSNARELIGVVPCGAILAARALIPERFLSAARSRAFAAVAVAAAVLPLAAAATMPTGTGPAPPLAAWLQARGLRYGVAGYWNASAITLQSGGRVQVRAVEPRYFGFAAYDWETKIDWYYPSRNYANFAIADLGPRTTANTDITVALAEKWFGPPASVHKLAGRAILIYHRNLLDRVRPALPLPPGSQPTPPAGHHHRR